MEEVVDEQVEAEDVEVDDAFDADLDLDQDTVHDDVHDAVHDADVDLHAGLNDEVLEEVDLAVQGCWGVDPGGEGEREPRLDFSNALEGKAHGDGALIPPH